MAKTRSPERDEWLKCSLSFAYWLDAYGWIYDATARGWVRFRLWPAQRATADTLARKRLVVSLKARQLGMTWLVVGYALWLLLFRPAATVLLFSKRDDEAVQLLSFRLAGMYQWLPAWMQARSIVTSNDHELRLSNGSAALAFPTTGGRSYTATLAVVDEADHTDDLDNLLDAVKPTIDGGGSLVLLSTVNKDRPASAFKRIYRSAVARENGYTAVFLSWSARPGRSAEWYDAQARDVQARTGALDSLYQEYPGSDVEALAGRSRDRRFAPEWLSRCEDTRARGLAGTGPGLPGLVVWQGPEDGREYVIGADPAEGNPQSDESAACVIDAITGDQVALLGGQCEPAVFAAYLAELMAWYGAGDRSSVGVLVERNNHGHAVLVWMAENGMPGVLRGLDGKAGWLTSTKNKALAYDAAAELLRDGSPNVRDQVTLRQLMEIRGATLQAGQGDHDDRATA